MGVIFPFHKGKKWVTPFLTISLTNKCTSFLWHCPLIYPRINGMIYFEWHLCCWSHASSDHYREYEMTSDKVTEDCPQIHQGNLIFGNLMIAFHVISSLSSTMSTWSSAPLPLAGKLHQQESSFFSIYSVTPLFIVKCRLQGTFIHEK